MNVFRRRATSSAIALAVVTGAAAFTMPAAYAAETPTPAPTPVETTAAATPELVTAGTEFTPQSTVDGVDWLATGMPQGEATVTITDPSGATSDVPATDGTAYIVTPEGTVEGSVILFDANDNPIPMPEGDYTLTVAVGDVQVQTAFKVTAEVAPSPTEIAIAAEKTTYTQSETAAGVSFTVSGLEPGQIVEDIIVAEPAGQGEGVRFPLLKPAAGWVADENGVIEGVAAWSDYVADDSETFYPGSYELIVMVAGAEEGSMVEAAKTTIEVTADPTDTPTPTQDVVEPKLLVEKELYTVAETAEGIGWAAEGLVPGEAYTVELVYPDGTVVTVPPASDNEQIAAEDGTAAGNIQYTVDGVPAPFEMEGTYIVRVTQGDLVLEATTAVGAPSETPQPTAGSGDKGDGNNGGPVLAETGATAETAGIALGAGLVLVAAGAGMMVVRRRMA